MPGKWGGARRARPPLDPPMRLVDSHTLVWQCIVSTVPNVLTHYITDQVNE